MSPPTTFVDIPFPARFPLVFDGSPPLAAPLSFAKRAPLADAPPLLARMGYSFSIGAPPIAAFSRPSPREYVS